MDTEISIFWRWIALGRVKNEFYVTGFGSWCGKQCCLLRGGRLVWEVKKGGD